MKKAIFLILALCFITTLAVAADMPVPTTDTITIKGTVIDNICATANVNNISEFVKTHTKQCALMPNCAASGYSILSEGKLTKFDKESNVKVEEFLQKPASILDVVVVAKKNGEELTLVSIDNQKEEKK
ncbi:MAG: hypothetical protein NTU54_01840 [Candidatus Omnitrophica bacterium]|nr:hypothetical protein [Candidatus Omnitrophota bacterium]